MDAINIITFNYRQESELTKTERKKIYSSLYSGFFDNMLSYYQISNRMYLYKYVRFITHFSLINLFVIFTILFVITSQT